MAARIMVNGGGFTARNLSCILNLKKQTQGLITAIYVGGIEVRRRGWRSQRQMLHSSYATELLILSDHTSNM
jgi:hypothetical protein